MRGNTLRTITLLCSLLLSSTALVGADKTHWSYDAHEGPANWGDLSPNYATCKTGKHQSPVNIHGTTATKLADIQFSYQPTPLDVVNNGHTIQVNYAKGSMFSLAGKNYQLLQLHFHSPSEHTVDGNPYDMVAHLVHQAADGQLGVIGILMKIGNANPVISSIWQHMPNRTDEQTKADIKINAANLLPSKHSYYNYSGSLTTPPCSEGVNWMIMQTPIEVSAEQVAAFTNLFANSTRPIQAINERIIHASQ